MALHSQGGSNPGRKGQPPLQIAPFDSVSTSRREFATARTFEVPTIEASLLAVRRESRIARPPEPIASARIPPSSKTFRQAEKIVRVHAIVVGLDVLVPVVSRNDHPDTHSAHVHVITRWIAFDVSNRLRLGDSPARATDRVNPIVRVHAMCFVNAANVFGHSCLSLPHCCGSGSCKPTISRPGKPMRFFPSVSREGPGASQ
jgi:hypothetical protein